MKRRSISALRAVVTTATVVLCGGFAVSASAADCNPLATATCIAPFPSNYWTDVDPSSPTGLRAKVSDDLIRPELLNALPTADGISPSGVFGNDVGFSAGVGAVFEFSKAPLASSLPADGGNAVLAYDLDSGQRVPINTSISDDSTNPLLVSQRTNVIQAFPRVRWEFGHRILVVVTKQLQVPGSSDPDFDTLAATQGVKSARSAAYVNEVRAALAQAAVPSANVRTATVFTVRPRSDSVGRTQALINDTMSRSHPTRKVSVSYDLLNPWVGALVTGEVRVDNYRKNGGKGDVDFTGATRSDQWIPFRLTLPRSAGEKPARVVIYAHGLGMFKESDLLVSTTNAMSGFATLSVDWPNHGVRSFADGGNVLLSLSPKKLGQQAGMLNQATFDMAGIYKALSTSMASTDYLRPRWLLNPLGIGSDKKPDINGARISMQGTSLGGVLGANFAALSPRLDGVDFSVAGVGISQLLSQSVVWLAFGFVMPHEASGTEHAVLIAALQQVIDPSDGINSFDYLRSPRPGQNKKPFLLKLGAGDSVVPNVSSIAMANLAGVPLVGKQLFAMPGVASASGYASDGSGVRQYPPFTGPFQIPLVTDASSHGIFMWPSAQADQKKFFDRLAKQP